MKLWLMKPGDLLWMTIVMVILTMVFLFFFAFGKDMWESFSFFKTSQVATDEFVSKKESQDLEKVTVIIKTPEPGFTVEEQRNAQESLDRICAYLRKTFKKPFLKVEYSDQYDLFSIRDHAPLNTSLSIFVLHAPSVMSDGETKLHTVTYGLSGESIEVVKTELKTLAVKMGVGTLVIDQNK